jgi:hypothetical protein
VRIIRPHEGVSENFSSDFLQTAESVENFLQSP